MKKLLFAVIMLGANPVFAQPANDEPCGAINIPVENTGCEATTIYSYTGATFSSAAGNPYCLNANVKDVWYKFIVPSNGEAFIAIAVNASEYHIAVELYKSTSCSALSQVSESAEGFPCLYTNGYSELSRSYKKLTPGSTAYLRVYQTFPQNPYPSGGSVKICVSNPNGLSDEPCNAGYFTVTTADPLGQVCVPAKSFNWVGATLTPAIPNPSCLQNMPAADIRDVWFKVKVPASGKLQVNTSSSYDFNTNNAAWNFAVAYTTAGGCSGTFTEIGCVMSWTGAPFRWTGLTPGSDIYFRLFRYYSANNGGNGDAKICAEAFNSLPPVDNSKKVGVGIDTPFAKLDVAGTGIFRDKITAGTDVEVRGNLIVQGNIVGKYGNAVLQGNTTVQGGPLKIDSLDLGNKLGNKIALFGGFGSASKYGFGIQNNTLQLFSDAAVSNIAFGYGDSYNFTERMRITNNGDAGMTLNGRLFLKNGTTNVNNSPGVWLYKADNTGLLGFMGAQNNQNVGFFGGPAGWGFTYDAVNSRVGIGVANPVSTLSVKGSTQELMSLNGPDGVYVSIFENNVARGYLGSFEGSAQDISLGTHTTNTAGNVHLSTTNNPRLTVTPSGNVGIGTVTPSAPLSFGNPFGKIAISLFKSGNGDVGLGVWGNELRLQNDVPNGKVSMGVLEAGATGVYQELAKAERNGAFAFSIFGNLWANGVTYSSDERFKQNITPINSPLHKLLLLNGVEYEMKTKEFTKNHFQPGRQIGLLAQQVEKIIPEAVNESNGYKGVDYARLVPLLIEAIKEQQQQIDELKRLLSVTR